MRQALGAFWGLRMPDFCFWSKTEACSISAAKRLPVDFTLCIVADRSMFEFESRKQQASGQLEQSVVIVGFGTISHTIGCLMKIKLDWPPPQDHLCVRSLVLIAAASELDTWEPLINNAFGTFCLVFGFESCKTFKFVWNCLWVNLLWFPWRHIRHINNSLGTYAGLSNW